MSDLIREHLSHMRNEGAAESTIRVRGNVIRRLHAALPFGAAFAATEEIETWLGQHTGSRWTHITYLNHIRAFYGWATMAGHLHGDPAAAIKRPKSPRCIPQPMTEGELATALCLPEPWRSIVILSAYAGLRAGEIAAARREHLTPDVVLVPCGKGGDPGAVPTHPLVWATFRDRPPGYLITSKRGRPVTAAWVSCCTRRALHKAGINRSIHKGRHRYGTLIQEIGGDIRVTQECMRHRSITSTVGYTLVARGRRNAAVEALPVPDETTGPATD